MSLSPPRLACPYRAYVRHDIASITKTITGVRARFTDDAQKVSLFLLEHTGMPPTSAERKSE